MGNDMDRADEVRPAGDEVSARARVTGRKRLSWRVVFGYPEVRVELPMIGERKRLYVSRRHQDVGLENPLK